MAFSDVATVGFVFRNGQKVNNGDMGRIPVLVGQTVNAVKAGTQLHNGIGKGAQIVVNTCSEVAKTDKVFNGLTKVVKFASDNVNPLIAASSGLKVILAKKEDRKKTFISEAGCVGGMLLGEGWMKKNLVGILDKLPITGKWKPIVKGLVFITGSITASTIGQKLCKELADVVDVPWGKAQREAYYQKQAAEKTAKTYQPLNYTA